jgi:antitoxin HicB
MMKHELDYPFELRPLAKDEGGGWLITFADLPGCMSDGETPEEAIASGKDAVIAWLEAAREAGREIPRPGEPPSGRFIARIPRSLHARLAARARQEGVSMNALVSAFLAESLGRRERTPAQPADTSSSMPKARRSETIEGDEMK